MVTDVLLWKRLFRWKSKSSDKLSAHPASKIWQAFRAQKEEAGVIRSGFGIYGIYHYDRAEPFEKRRRESDLEHTAGVIVLLLMALTHFPKLVPRRKIIYCLALALVHEIGERLTGDIPDDGSRDEQRKDALEREEVKQFTNLMPKWLGRRVYQAFLEMQAKSTSTGRVVYIADKLEAVLQGLVYESLGMGGDIREKEKLMTISEQDRRGMQTTGSYWLVDIWSAHFLEKIWRMPEAQPFIEILYAAVMEVRGEWFPWVAKVLPELKIDQKLIEIYQQ